MSSGSSPSSARIFWRCKAPIAARVSTVADPETGDERPLTVRKYSDRLMEVLLKWRYGDQMADRLRVKVDSTGLDAEALLRMSADERKALTGLLSKYHANKEQDDDE